MDRKELKALELNDEQIEAVMSKHGDLKAKYQDKVDEIQDLKSDKKDLEKQLDEAKEKADKVEALETKNKEYQENIENYKKQLASNDLDKEIIKAVPDAHNIDDIFALLDKEQFEYGDNDEITNFDDVLNDFRENKPHLFKESEQNQDIVTNEKNNYSYKTNSKPGNSKGETDFVKLGKELASQFNDK
ncbi:phage scaffolding protein [Staphylococcus xylosus]